MSKAVRPLNVRLEKDGGYRFDRPAASPGAYCLDPVCGWRTHVDAVHEARRHSRLTDHIVCIERVRCTVLVPPKRAKAHFKGAE